MSNISKWDVKKPLLISAMGQHQPLLQYCNTKFQLYYVICGARNFALMEKIALNLLKAEDSKNMSIKSKRLVAAWDNEFLLKILRIQTK